MTDMTLLTDRAQRHAALGERHRLQVVDALRLSDRTPSELRDLTGLSSNHLAFHLDVLEEAGLLERHQSEGDGRRRYVSLRWAALRDLAPPPLAVDGPVVFVCTRNAARSQLAAALWRQRTGGEAASAGAMPADGPDAAAIEIAVANGLDTSEWRSVGYDDVDLDPALVVSVCDRAREGDLPWAVPHLHWSVPDPAGGPRGDYERAYDDIEGRIDRLAAAGSAA